MKYKIFIVLIFAVATVLAYVKKSQHTANNSIATGQSASQQQKSQQGAGAQNSTAQQSTPAQNQQKSQTAVQSSTTQSQSMDGLQFSGESSDLAPQPQVYEVDISANAFSPASITLMKGDYIQFVNKDSAGHWLTAVGSYPGIAPFDSGKAILPGAYWRFQFKYNGTWSYELKDNTAVRGKVIVQ